MVKRKKKAINTVPATSSPSQSTRKSSRLTTNPKPGLTKVTKKGKNKGTTVGTKFVERLPKPAANKQKTGSAGTSSKTKQIIRQTVVDLSKDTAIVDLKPGSSVLKYVHDEKASKKEQPTKKKRELERMASASQLALKEEESDSSEEEGIHCSVIPRGQICDTDDSSSMEAGGTSSDDVYVVDMKRNNNKRKVKRASPRQPAVKQSKVPDKPQNQQQKLKFAKPPSASTVSPKSSHTPDSERTSVATPQISHLKQEETSDPSTPESEITSDDSEMEQMSDEGEDQEVIEESNSAPVDRIPEPVAKEWNSAPLMMDPEPLIPQATYDKSRFRLLPYTQPNLCMAVIHPMSVLPFHGQVKLTVILGKVKVHGYDTHRHIPIIIHAPKCSPAVCIESTDFKPPLPDDDYSMRVIKNEIQQYFTPDKEQEMVEEVINSIKKDGVTVVVLEPHQSNRIDYVSSFSKYGDLLEKVDHPKWGKTTLQQNILSSAHDIGFFPVQPDIMTPIMKTPQVYHYVSDIMLQALDKTEQMGGPQPVTMVCGWHNVGKSTMARYLINTMLSKSQTVCFLDCDLGQTEFNPSTMLGISVIKTPLLGPPFTHEVTPERMCFFGETSPANSPDVYLDIIKDLYQYYLDHLQHMPLVVNCMGWMIGIGLCIQIDLIRLMKPSHLLQLLPTPHPRKAPILDREYMQHAKGLSSHTGEDTEYMQHDKGLSPHTEEDDDNELGNMKHILVNMPWKSEEGRKYRAPHFREMSLLSHLSQLMPGQEKVMTYDPLCALTPYTVPWGSVGVHVCNADVPVSQIMYALNGSVVGLCKADSEQMISLKCDGSNELPTVFRSMPVCECLGLGIIRGIDPINKMFYILSHLPEPTIKQVNALLKGSLALPQFVLQQGQENGKVPYITSEFHFNITGGGTIKRRYAVPQK